MSTSTNVIIVILLLVILALVIVVSLVLRFVKEVYKSRSQQTNNNNVSASSNNNTFSSADSSSDNRSNRRTFVVRGSLFANDPNLSFTNASGVFIIEPTLPRYSACSFNSSPICAPGQQSSSNLPCDVQASPLNGTTQTSQTLANERMSRSFHMHDLVSPPPKYEDLFGVVHIATSQNSADLGTNQSRTNHNSLQPGAQISVPVISIQPPPCPMSPPISYSSCLRDAQLHLPSYG